MYVQVVGQQFVSCMIKQQNNFSGVLPVALAFEDLHWRSYQWDLAEWARYFASAVGSLQLAWADEVPCFARALSACLDYPFIRLVARMARPSRIIGLAK